MYGNEGTEGCRWPPGGPERWSGAPRRPASPTRGAGRSAVQGSKCRSPASRRMPPGDKLPSGSWCADVMPARWVVGSMRPLSSQAMPVPLPVAGAGRRLAVELAGYDDDCDHAGASAREQTPSDARHGPPVPYATRWCQPRTWPADRSVMTLRRHVNRAVLQQRWPMPGPALHDSVDPLQSGSAVAVIRRAHDRGGHGSPRMRYGWSGRRCRALVGVVPRLLKEGRPRGGRRACTPSRRPGVAPSPAGGR